jgi:hypothetical protein
MLGHVLHALVWAVGGGGGFLTTDLVLGAATEESNKTLNLVG